MELIDSHTHLYSDKFLNDREDMLERARQAGLTHCLLPNIDGSSIKAMLALEARAPKFCYPMMGLHPCSVKEDYEAELNIVREWLDRRDFIAIGEIGIDLYWDKTFLEEQKIAFRTQVEWALEFDRPIVIHARDSLDLLIDMVGEYRGRGLRGVFHCFTGGREQARAIVELGFYLGIGGVLTYKNSGLAEALQDIDLARMILETDSPYLAPVPHRGKRNESAYVRYVADKLAQVKKTSVEEVAAVTTANTKTLFALS